MDECSTLPEAMKLVFRRKYELALIDLESVVGTCQYGDYEQLASDLVRDHVPLLIVLGPDTDPVAEITARQIGAWVYLSGFDEQANFKQLFREARQSTKQLSGRSELLEASLTQSERS